jgi:hypothetical protein
MNSASLHKKIIAKSSNPDRIAESVIRDPQWIPSLVEGMRADRAALKYGSEKVLRIISEKRPDLIYPYFDFLAAGLDSQNSILKWGAILCLANLASVDTAGRLDAIFDRYFQPISGPVLITAGNTMRGAARIAMAKPQLADRIVAEILKVERAEYKTTECRNIAIGHAIDTFNRIFELTGDKKRIIRFVKRQVMNPRLPVRRRAEGFLRKHRIQIEQRNVK